MTMIQRITHWLACDPEEDISGREREDEAVRNVDLAIDDLAEKRAENQKKLCALEEEVDKHTSTVADIGTCIQRARLKEALEGGQP